MKTCLTRSRQFVTKHVALSRVRRVKLLNAENCELQTLWTEIEMSKGQIWISKDLEGFETLVIATAFIKKKKSKQIVSRCEVKFSHKERNLMLEGHFLTNPSSFFVIFASLDERFGLLDYKCKSFQSITKPEQENAFNEHVSVNAFDTIAAHNFTTSTSFQVLSESAFCQSNFKHD